MAASDDPKSTTGGAIPNPYLPATRRTPSHANTRGSTSSNMVTPTTNRNGTSTACPIGTTVSSKRTRATECTDLSMDESYDSPLAIGTVVLTSGPREGGTKQDSSGRIKKSAVGLCDGDNGAGVGHEDDDDDDNSTNLQQLFGNPAVNGERGRKKLKKSRGNGPPKGDRPIVSVVRTGTRKGPVQKTMPQFLITYKSRAELLSTIYSPLFTRLSVTQKPDHQDERDVLADFRGFEVGLDGDRMPPHYCSFCRCPPPMCHDKVFGRLVELLIIDKIHGAETEPTCMELKELFQEEYERALRQKVCENTGTLDLNSWAVPYCLTSSSLDRLLRYVRACEYHYEMHSNITVGRGVPKNAQGKMFGRTSK
jgi:hypothetical protein